MRIKICGITQPLQGQAIAQLGATALGFICVPASPRYVAEAQIREVIEQLSTVKGRLDLIGVFANAGWQDIAHTVAATGLTGIQLHGDESPKFCASLRQALPSVEIIKALRVRSYDALQQAIDYVNYVDTLLLDAYHPQMLGGTGQTLDWNTLKRFNPPCPWLLAGGLTPDNVMDALKQLQPNGIDLSSGLERAPGDKDLDKVARLFEKLGGTKV